MLPTSLPPPLRGDVNLHLHTARRVAVSNRSYDMTMGKVLLWTTLDMAFVDVASLELPLGSKGRTALAAAAESPLEGGGIGSRGGQAGTRSIPGGHGNLASGSSPPGPFRRWK